MLRNEFMQNAFIVSIFISVLCPCIGIFLVLRRYSMIGDTLSHASLAGISLALAAGGSPLLGAFLFTSACGALIEFLRGYFKKNADLVLSVVLALCVGVAVTLISSGRLNTSADKFMFGSMLTVTRADMLMALTLSVLSVVTLLALYHQMLYIAYDEEAAAVAGVRVRLINYIFSILVAAAVSVSIRIVGVLVLSSMIALPVASALQLGRGFRVTLICSVLFSFADILLGLYLSYYLNVAPGGFTALVSVAALAVVLLGKTCARALRGRI
ncbi:MAG: metal ABC transporter permease [Oscillospiraceae bacterium]|jgi:zinc transport system permease protein|nr:metal ABC transporter permease [Oscillospiraceae bacterium]